MSDEKKLTPVEVKKQVTDRAAELEKKYDCKIHPLLFNSQDDGDGEWIIGFMKEPNRLTKIRVLDKTLTGMMVASAELLEAIILKEESDPRIMSEAPEYDKYYLGAVMAAQSIIKYSANTFKKK